MRDRDTLSWALALLLVDAGAWGLSAALAPQSLALALLVAYSALSLLCTVGLYLDAARGGHPGEVLKGLRHPWAQVLLFPFRVVSWCVWLAARVLRRGDGPTEVIPGLWVGPRPLPHEIRALSSRGVRAVVDLTSELPTLHAMREGPWRRLAIPILDRTSPDDDALAAAVEWIAARRAAGDGVYVHCAFGRGRSGLMACAAVVGLGAAATADEALALVRARRPLIRLRPAQLASVARYAVGVSRSPARG